MFEQLIGLQEIAFEQGHFDVSGRYLMEAMYVALDQNDIPKIREVEVIALGHISGINRSAKNFHYSLIALAKQSYHAVLQKIANHAPVDALVNAAASVGAVFDSAGHVETLHGKADVLEKRHLESG